jgi:uncharacterized integral membrane protein
LKGATVSRVLFETPRRTLRNFVVLASTFLRSRKLVVFSCTTIAYSSVAVLAYVATFLRRFGVMWPEMFCYDPAPEYFQLNIAVPIVILGGALVLCGATRARTFERQPGAVIIFVAGSGWALQIIATVIHRLAAVSYDSGCGRGEEWFGRLR